MATYTPKELYQNVVPNSLTSVLGPVTNKTIVKEIFLCNYTASPVQISLAKLLNGETVPADKNYIARDGSMIVAAHETKQITLSLVIEAGGQLFIGADTASAVAANVCGVEVTA